MAAITSKVDGDDGSSSIAGEERVMFAVVGDWQTDPARSELQRQGLEGIVSGIRGMPGLVGGHWTADADRERSRTFIVFDDRAGAERFAQGVTGNAAAQERAGVTLVSLEVLEVIAWT